MASAACAPRQITWATFFGTLFAGVFLLQLDCLRHGLRHEANRVLWIGVPVAIGVLTVQMLVTKGGQVLGIGALIGIYQAAKQSQWKLLADHQRAGGRTGSAGVAIGIGLLWLAGIVSLIIVVGMLGLMTGWNSFA